MTWRKGKAFRKNGRLVRYIYKNGRKSTKRLVSANRYGRGSSRRRY